MQMYQGIVKVLSTFHFRFVFMQIEYRNVLTKVEIYVSIRPPHLSHEVDNVHSSGLSAGRSRRQINRDLPGNLSL